MHKLIICITLLLLLLSCGKRPTIEELAIVHLKNVPTFNKLREMVKEDKKDKNCLEIGLDHMTDQKTFNLWKESDNTWTASGTHSAHKFLQGKLSTDTVLDHIGLDSQRYQEYITLFRKSQSERVRHCDNSINTDNATGPISTILAYRDGFVFGGCSVEAIWEEKLPNLDTINIREGDFIKFRPLKEGWYLRYYCGG